MLHTVCSKDKLVKFTKYLPGRFRKAERGVVWWRTRVPRAMCHNGVTVTKRDHFQKFPCFSRS